MKQREGDRSYGKRVEKLKEEKKWIGGGGWGRANKGWDGVSRGDWGRWEWEDGQDRKRQLERNLNEKEKEKKEVESKKLIVTSFEM